MRAADRLLLLLTIAAGCTARPQPVTFVEVQVLFDSRLTLDQLVFDLADDNGAVLLAPTARPVHAGAPLPSGSSVDIIVPDSLAGQLLTVRVLARRQEQDMMDGKAMVTPLLQQRTTVSVVLGKRTDLTSLAITPDQPLQVGATQPLKATGTFFDGTTLDFTTSASWASSDDTVLSVGAGGLATAKMAGMATVTASVLGVSAQLLIQVSTANLKSLSITPVAPKIPVGLSRAFIVTGAFDDGTTRDLTGQVPWTVTDPNIAAFDGMVAGLLHARQPGMITIGASFQGAVANDMVEVSSAQVTSLVISPVNPKLALGTLRQLFATGLLSDGSSVELTDQADWTSSDPTLADVSSVDGSRGQASAVGEGMVTISASFGGVTGTDLVTVTAAALRSLAITPPATTLANGTQAQLTLTGVFSDGTAMDLTNTAMWTSDGAAVSVGNDAADKGQVTAHATGTVTVHASFGGLSAGAAVTGTSAVLKSLSVTPSGPTLPKGGQLQFIATGTFSDQTVQNLTDMVTWSAGDGSVLNISNAQGTSGIAFGVNPGSVVAVASLGGVTGSTSVNVTAAVLRSLTITPSGVSIANGTEVQLHASGTFSDQSTQDLTSQVTWTSSQMSVVVVSNAPGHQGLATSLSSGSGTIGAMLDGISISTQVTVTPAQLASIGVQPSNPTVPSGLPQSFHAIGVFTDQTTQDLTNSVLWSSSDPLTVSISNAAGSHGVAVAAGAQGSVTISAAVGAISGSAGMTVTPAVLTTISITPSNPSTPAGTSMSFAATGLYSDGSHRDLTQQVTWAAGVPDVAAISNADGSRGQCSALGVGTSVITATLGSISASTQLTVTDAVLTALSVQPTNPSIALGTQLEFTATGSYSDGTHRDLTNQVSWSSSMPQIAAISNTDGTRGLATSLAVGSTSIISAAVNNYSATTTLTVTPASLRSLSVTPGSAMIPLGTTQHLSATGTFTDNSVQDLTAQVTWISGNPALATISNDNGTQGLVVSIAVGGPVAMTAQLSGKSAGAQITVTPAGLRSISVTPASASVPLGMSLELTATGIYTDNSTVDLTSQVTWSSGSLDVAGVSNAAGSAGLVTSVAVGGPIAVTAQLAGKAGSAAITISDAVLQSITVTPASSSLPLGTTQTMQAVGLYSDGTMRELTEQVSWNSSNENLATVSNAAANAGQVTTVSAGGPITVTASLGGTSGSASLTITQAELVSISVTPTQPSTPLGIPLQLTATGLYTDSSTLDLTRQATWDSSDAGVAAVSNAGDERGLVTPVSQNSATISASFAGKSGSTPVTVTSAVLTSLTISPSQPSVALGFTQQFTVSGLYSDQSAVDLTAQATWSSSDESVATISNADGSQGLATPLRADAGTTIRADFGGKSTTTSFSVTPATLQFIVILPANPSVPLGLTLQLSAIGHFSDFSTQDLTAVVSWTSDTGIAIVGNGSSDAGSALGIAQGMTQVSARFGQITENVTLTVSAAQLLSLTLSPVSIAAGTQVQATAMGNFSGGGSQDLTAQVTWSSGDEAVATVSNAPGSEGLISSMAPGSTTLNATLGGVDGSAPLTIKDVMLTAITVTPASPTIGVAQNLPLTATGMFDDATTQDLTTQVSWSSADDTVVVVSNADGMRGLCSGVMAGGPVTVSASFLGQVGGTDITVTP